MEGPIPDNKAFQNASATAFQGSIGLCGHVQGLEPCKPSSKMQGTSTKFNKRLFLLIALSLVGPFLFLPLLVAFFEKKGAKKDPEAAQNSQQNEELSLKTSVNRRSMHDEIIQVTNTL